MSILEARDKSTFKEYHYLTIKEGATPAPWFIKNEKSATASSLNVLDGKNSPLLDNDLKIKSDPKKGYEFLEKENEVTLKAEHFHNQLKTIIKPDAYTALNLSENDIRTVFDTQFAKLYPNGLKKQGILKDGEYYQLTVNKGAKWEATVKSPKESVPANLQELMNNMHAYLKASVALRAKKPQYTRLSEGEIKSKAKTTNTPESSDWTNFISGAWGSDVFMVEGFTQFDVQKKDQKVELVILDGKNERIIIPFSRTASSGLKLQKDIVSTGGQVYNITYQGDQLYVFPAKDKKK
ncbi:MAG: hypothetical protein LBD75_01980 [Candidatus Peribacteria bacterium]|nr:hypothetical protein [Candidatus Peribacteria bacterium]